MLSICMRAAGERSIFWSVRVALEESICGQNLFLSKPPNPKRLY